MLGEQSNRREARPEAPWSGTEVGLRLQAGQLCLPPVQLRALPPAELAGSRLRGDGVLEATWQKGPYRFVYEYKQSSTPRSVEMAALQARQNAAQAGMLPMVIVPYLSEDRLRFLEAVEVSGVDLCGNGLIMTPAFRVERSGKPNLFKSSQPIKAIYRGVSSLFARCFLLRREYSSLAELRAFALGRLKISDEQDASPDILTAGTGSKVLNALREDLVISKEGGRIVLIDPRKLLINLREQYVPPTGARLVGKSALSPGEVWQQLQISQSPERSFRCVATGLGSANRYRLLSSPEKLSLYVTDLSRASDLLRVSESRVFPDVELIEEKGLPVYFDAREDDSAAWASPIQVWLELTSAGPREQEAALALESDLVNGRAETLS